MPSTSPAAAAASGNTLRFTPIGSTRSNLTAAAARARCQTGGAA